MSSALVLSTAARAAGGPGSAFGEALRLTNTAWALSMSEALTAAAEGVNAVTLNPAGVLDTGLTTFHLTHIAYVQRLGEDYAAYAQRLPLGSALGAGVHVLYDAGTSRTLEDEATGDYAGEAGTYASGFAVGGAAWAVDLSSWLPWAESWRPAGGFGVRLLGQQVDRTRTIGITTDAGLKAHLGGGFLLGAVVQNLGLAAGERRLPLQAVAGLAWKGSTGVAGGDAALLEVDLPFAVDRALLARAGAEYRIRAGAFLVAVRGGWSAANQTPGSPGLTGGLGFRWLIGRLPWGLDYAYIPWGVFGAVHAASVTLALVPPPPPREEEAPAAPPPPAAASTAFHPLRGERARYVVRVKEPAEVSALLLDAAGNPLLTLRERSPAPPGDVSVEWDGSLQGRAPAPYDVVYRISIQLGDQTYYQDVVPKGD